MGLFIAFAVLAAQAAPAISVESKGTPPSQVQTAQDPLSGQLGQALMLLRDKKPADAIAIADQVISAEEAANRSRAGMIFSARSGAEALLYAGLGASQKKDAIVLDGTWSTAYFAKAFALVDLGHSDQAKPYLDKAIALAPMNAQFLAERGEWFKNHRDWPKAYADFQSASAAAELSPDEVKSFEKRRALRGMAFARTEQGQLEEAEKLLKECLEIDASDETAKHELEYLRSLH